MQNIKILKNFPEQVMNVYKNLYNFKYVGKKPEDYWSNNHSASSVTNVHKKILDRNLPISSDGIELYYVSNGMMSPHIDRRRKTALQIPIDLNINNSFTFAAKYNDLSKFKPIVSQFTSRKISSVGEPINNPTDWFYEWDSELYDKYNLEFPVLQNVSLPHGGANYDHKPRVFFSVSYKSDFDKICTYFESWM